MHADFPLPIVLLLHEGGWDEALMVAVGLGIAYLVIVWTGRRNQDDDDEWEDGEDLSNVELPEAKTDQAPGSHP